MRELLIVRDASGIHTERGDITVGSMTLLAFGAAGVLTVLFALVSHWAQRKGIPVTNVEPQVRVVSGVPVPAPGGDGKTATVEGVARKSTVELRAPLDAEPCLAFGVRGRVGQATIDDAEGGEFDLELPDGQRMTVSLGHAVLESQNETVVDVSLAALADDDDDLDPLITFAEARLLRIAPEPVSLALVVLRDGDRVRVTGRTDEDNGGSSYRGQGKVLSGTAQAPLRVALLAEEAATVQR
jgi:hypothetical protein